MSAGWAVAVARSSCSSSTVSVLSVVMAGGGAAVRGSAPARGGKRLAMSAILLDANRLGLFDDNPVAGVKPPQYDPKRVVIPSPAQLRQIRTAGDDSFLLVADLMSGCGMRNGEAFAVNVNNIVANDVYRITEQVNRTTCRYERLKHRKPGEYRDVPLPARVRRSIEWYADKHGTVDGYLLRHPGDPARTFPHYHIANQWQRIKKAGQTDIPDGMVVYGLRHFFASNCLTHGIPITDVAEWMGQHDHRDHLQDLPPPHARLHQQGRQDPQPRPHRITDLGKDSGGIVTHSLVLQQDFAVRPIRVPGHGPRGQRR
ncbi:hypothetical protein STENM327S_03007 [Streptomyces tendae]